MSDNQNVGFGKFVPGFDFLQNLTKGSASQSQSLAQMPSLANWVAPTLNVEELEKRISELKAVHFWLDQNSRALGATIQALELQKMTLATLKGMNFNMGELANAMKLKADTMMEGMKQRVGAATSQSDTAAGADTAAAKGAAADTASRTDSADADAKADGAGSTQPDSGRAASAQADAKPAASVVDPLQWWGSLTQQFQQIATAAMKDVAAKTGMDTARTMAGAAAKEAFQNAADMATGTTSRKSTNAGKNAGKGAAKSAAAKSAAAKGAAKSAANADASGAATSAKKAPVKRAKKKGGA